jgi:hypothetical protein
MMAFNPRGFLRIVCFAGAGVYPVLVFVFLVVLKAPVRIFSLFITAFALAAFLQGTSKKKREIRAALRAISLRVSCCFPGRGYFVFLPIQAFF